MAPEGTVSLTLRKPSTRRLSLQAFAEAGLFDAVATRIDDLDQTDAELAQLREAQAWRRSVLEEWESEAAAPRTFDPALALQAAKDEFLHLEAELAAAEEQWLQLEMLREETESAG